MLQQLIEEELGQVMALWVDPGVVKFEARTIGIDVYVMQALQRVPRRRNEENRRTLKAFYHKQKKGTPYKSICSAMDNPK